MTKHLHSIMTMLAFVGSMSIANAQEANPQIGNGDFESWENYGKSNHAPDNWNSFETAGGSLSGTVSAQQVDQSTDVRPGSEGQYSVRIYSRAVKLGIITLAVAQGNLTLGQIQAGSMTAAGKENHNKSIVADEAKSEKLGKLPKAIKVWAKYNPAKHANNYQARVAAIVHDEYDYITYGTADADANDSLNASHAVAKAELNFSPVYGEDEKAAWQLLEIPFSTEGCTATSPDYILINFSTSSFPGKADAGDELFIDDIELVYDEEENDDEKENINQGEDDGINLATLIKSEYEGSLVVSINGQTASESNENVLIETAETTNTINFYLKNFILGAGTEDEMAIGNINIKNIKLTGNAKQIEFEYADNILIAEGDDPNVQFWMGPMLGEIPVSIKGVVNGDDVVIGIDIEMVDLGQTIHVDFDNTKSFETAISTIASAKKNNATYSINGTKINGNLDSMPRGMYIVNGKKIAK